MGKTNNNTSKHVEYRNLSRFGPLRLSANIYELQIFKIFFLIDF